MRIFVYLDESGLIHKNSKTKYFAVGGYFTFLNDKVKIVAKYKKINFLIKKKKDIALDTEIKSYNMSTDEKIEIFKEVQKFKNFYGCAKIFAKDRMKKEILHSNIFFNYAVKLIINDCILPLLKNSKEQEFEFFLHIDNRNVGVGNLKNLENYLNTEFCMFAYNFSVKYYDSRSSYGIQLADLIVNTFYNYYKDKKLIRELLPFIKNNKFKISLFPKKYYFIDFIRH